MWIVHTGNDFPSSFESVAKKIHRLLFHVLSHIYESHYELIVILRLHGHLNTLFQHFMLFNTTHLLLEDKETEALDELFQKLLGSDRRPADSQAQGDTSMNTCHMLDDHRDCQTESSQNNLQPPEKWPASGKLFFPLIIYFIIVFELGFVLMAM